MNKLLALAAVVAFMSACTGLSGTGGDPPAATIAAMMGYHGPVRAAGPLDDN